MLFGYRRVYVGVALDICEIRSGKSATCKTVKGVVGITDTAGEIPNERFKLFVRGIIESVLYYIIFAVGIKIVSDI